METDREIIAITTDDEVVRQLPGVGPAPEVVARNQAAITAATLSIQGLRARMDAQAAVLRDGDRIRN